MVLPGLSVDSSSVRLWALVDPCRQLTLRDRQLLRETREVPKRQLGMIRLYVSLEACFYCFRLVGFQSTQSRCFQMRRALDFDFERWIYQCGYAN